MGNIFCCCLRANSQREKEEPPEKESPGKSELCEPGDHKSDSGSEPKLDHPKTGSDLNLEAEVSAGALSHHSTVSSVNSSTSRGAEKLKTGKEARAFKFGVTNCGKVGGKEDAETEDMTAELDTKLVSLYELNFQVRIYLDSLHIQDTPGSMHAVREPRSVELFAVTVEESEKNQDSGAVSYTQHHYSLVQMRDSLADQNAEVLREPQQDAKPDCMQESHSLECENELETISEPMQLTVNLQRMDDAMNVESHEQNDNMQFITPDEEFEFALEPETGTETVSTSYEPYLPPLISQADEIMTGSQHSQDQHDAHKPHYVDIHFMTIEDLESDAVMMDVEPEYHRMQERNPARDMVSNSFNFTCLDLNLNFTLISFVILHPRYYS